MLETSEKIQIARQLLRNFEADKYSAELNLKIAKAVGMNDLIQTHGSQAAIMTNAIKILVDELKGLEGKND